MNNTQGANGAPNPNFDPNILADFSQPFVPNRLAALD